MLATHLDAERRYDGLRRSSLRAIASQIDSINNLEFKLIDHRALSTAEKWKDLPNRKVDWEWNNYPNFKLRYPKRFELALWHNSHLASLSLGRPTYNATGLRLDFLEKNSEYSDIKVFQITLAAMNVYADALGARELRIMNPINDEVKKYYETFGLIYVPNGDYLVTRI
ncbi:hypothetical protein CN03_03530 [Thalassolituus oleivorans]|uniref:hypothetical protein n=1 Tax=Thalassolituus oleivorans TaxID=187493 RepID=UPI0009493D05|nr:hypothetical protein [Thalassolituus oleivorans]APR66078.1 hypothetical protein CN03_03530 [Thalassolituus oleivorans]